MTDSQDPDARPEKPPGGSTYGDSAYETNREDYKLVKVESLWTRKGFWLGVAMMAVPVLEYLATQEIVDWRSALLAVAGALTIAVRYVTKSPVKLK